MSAIAPLQPVNLDPWLCSASAGTSPSMASAQPAEQELQLLWSQLSAVKQLSVVGSAKFLYLGCGACFPQEGIAVQGRLFIRQCYLELAELLEQHLTNGGRSFIIRGNPGNHRHMQI